jgi:hydrogenase maturation protein HypF
MQKRLAVEVKGIVQGVGFRPFVFRLADRLGLSGFVRNDADGVYLEIQGPADNSDRFINDLQNQLPPLAQITEFHFRDLPLNSDQKFRIISSVRQKTAETLISPDIATCPACLEEMLSPTDRRYQYPFINCTNCGPRFTIIDELPYDRKNTSMAVFRMCPDCEREYNDPADRRFHAQPNACRVCGPGVMAIGAGVTAGSGTALQAAVEALKGGKIAALKGLGGFHLAVDAANDAAVSELRRRKRRFEKPLALMVARVAVAGDIAWITADEYRLLTSIHRPIVLCRRKENTGISSRVSLDNDDLGLMLPYTPLHTMLFELGAPEILVMTSANLSEEPICHDNANCLAQMDAIADLFLMHNRDIRVRCDDSVVRSYQGQTFFIRRARGYAPRPVMLQDHGKSVLATGGQLKNTVTLTRGHYAFVSQHIGDLENLETLAVFEETIRYLRELLEIQPAAIVHDLHPEYLSTKWSQDQNELPVIGIQHHYAHILSVMAEEALNERVIGLALDGAGYGTDGQIWGGELLLTDPQRFDRFAAFTPVPMPGGEKAILEPWRMAVAYLDHFLNDEGLALRLFPGQADKIPIIRQMIAKKINTPMTTSCGRLFDAVAAILGLRSEVNYEGQAAVILESFAQRGISRMAGKQAVNFALQVSDGQIRIDAAPVIRYLVTRLLKGDDREDLALVFHRALAGVFTELIIRAREETGLEKAALSGGCFQNMLLLRILTDRLIAAGFKVFTNRQVPVNDGGISLGQAYWGIHNL